MNLHDITVFLQKWSPHIWLFGSLFGVFMSSVLMKRAYEQRVVLRASDRRNVSAYWFRHALWYFLLHTSYVFIGAFAVAGIRTDWTTLLTLVILVGTPLVLVYRVYDSLRVQTTVNGRG